MALIAVMVVSCGGGVNHSDPKSVADVALECYDKGDYETMKTLVNPENTYILKQMDVMIESENYKAEHGKKDLTPKTRTFNSVEERPTGKETGQTKNAVVIYDGDYPTRVSLEYIDGKWYFEQFK